MSSSSSSTPSKTYSLQTLLAAPKGVTEYVKGDAFLLHVFWEAPSVSAALKVLGGLRKCAVATHRDTPCVPTYFFRISEADADVYGSGPCLVRDHPQIVEAKKKIQVGIPLPAVTAGFVRAGFDPALLDLDLDAELPESVRSKPVALEFTEVYLDEQAFMEHAGSRDYLDGYGAVMDPSGFRRIPITLRLGDAPQNMVERILEPVLKERVQPLAPNCFVWKPTSTPSSVGSLFLSLDVELQDGQDSASVAALLPSSFTELCTMCVTFPHPYRDRTVRLMSVLPSLPSHELLASLAAALRIVRGEVHTNSFIEDGSDDTAHKEAVRQALDAAGLNLIHVNAREFVGYALHQKAAELKVREADA